MYHFHQWHHLRLVWILNRGDEISGPICRIIIRFARDVKCKVVNFVVVVRNFMVVGAGYYVPELAKLVFDRNKQLSEDKKINFKGFMVSNLATLVTCLHGLWNYPREDTTSVREIMCISIPSNLEHDSVWKWRYEVYWISWVWITSPWVVLLFLLKSDE